MDSATTLRPVELGGRGLFSGQPCLIRIDPAEYGSGLAFRVNGVRILALTTKVRQAFNHTLLEDGGQQVRVTEHLLAALWAAGIDTADIVQLEGPELPNVDGSALPFYEALATAGRKQFNRRRKALIAQRIRLGDDNAYFVLEPAQQLVIDYHFSHPELGQQDFHFPAIHGNAATEVLAARTFATAAEVEAAQAAGVLLNDDESAGLVVREGAPNQPLRFANEFARHKVLDLLGDLYLLPFDWPCHLTAYRTGHALNHKLARLLWDATQKGDIRVL